MALALLVSWISPSLQAQPAYDVIGQPNTASTTLGSRCVNANARFNYDPNGFEQFGPSGLAVDQDNHLFVTDFAGDRVLIFDHSQLGAPCPEAIEVVSGGGQDGPEAVAWDPESGILFVASTLNHSVRGFKKENGNWTLDFILGTGTAGSGMNQLHFPRGLAVDPGGRLFVADDFNDRVLIFNPPFDDFEAAVDSIGAGNDGGFGSPKAVAMIGHTLFVADWENNKVLRFTGPFTTPTETYTASGIFSGLFKPVDLAVHPDGSLLVTDQGNVRVARYADAASRASVNAPDSTFNDFMNTEPLGIVADRSGRIFVADYRAFRVLVRNESIGTLPINPNATVRTTTVLADLHSRPDRATDRVAIGQQLITYLGGTRTDPNAWHRDFLALEARGDPKPMMMAGDVEELVPYPPGGNPPDNQNATDEMINHGQAGGIVAVSWHARNPATGGGYNTSPLTTTQLQDMINPLTPIGQTWAAQIDRAAGLLQQFEDADVPVLFRPLHEQNHPFFWWGHNGASGAALRLRQAAWTAVWRHLVNRLTVDKGLNNLLFVFGPNQVTFSGITAPMTYFPGGDWTDVVAIDIYDDELDMAGGQRGLRHYMALTATGKPFGIAEFGQGTTPDGSGTDAPGADWDARTLTTRILDSYPRTTFASAWFSQPGYIWALPDVAFTSEMLADPLIQTLDAFTELQNGAPVSNLAGDADSEQFFRFTVPAGATNLVVAISGGTGDADLYVNFGQPPTLEAAGCAPFSPSNDEDCTYPEPDEGQWFVMVRGFAAYQDVSLIVQFNVPGGCDGVDAILQNTLVLDLEVLQCVATGSMEVRETLDVQPGGRVEIYSPRTRFEPGLSLPVGAQLAVFPNGGP